MFLSNIPNARASGGCRISGCCVSLQPSCLGGGGDPSPSNPCFPSGQNNVWSGYEFALNCGSTSLIKTWASWIIPTLRTPPTGCSTFCGLAIWTGLEDTFFAADNLLVQGGILAQWTCGAISCSYSYSAVYQFGAKSRAQNCGLSVNPGDSIMVDITVGSTNSHTVSVTDTTTGRNRPFTQTYSMTPYFGAFMAERPLNCIGSSCGYDDLAQFTQFSINCEIEGVSVSSPCYNSYNAGSFKQDLMVNNGTQNVGLGPVASSSSFTETWWTRVNT